MLYQSLRIGLIAIALSLAVAPSALGQTCCERWWRWSHEGVVVLEYTYTGPTPTAVPASAGVHVTAVHLGMRPLTSNCASILFQTGLVESVVDHLSDSDEANLLSRSVTVGPLEADEGCTSEAEVQLSTGSGYSAMWWQHGGLSEYEQGIDGPFNVGFRHIDAYYPAAKAPYDVTWEGITASSSVTVELSAAIDSILWMYDECTPLVAASRTQVRFVRVRIAGTAVTAPTTVAGSLAYTAEGTAQRLGFFEDEEFDADPTSATSWEIRSGTYEVVTVTADNAGDLTLDVRTDDFTLEAADLDDDGDCDDADRLALGAAIGSVLEDDDYNPRADFDVDGDVDVTDYGVFLSLFGGLTCVADMTGDGLVTGTDWDDFMTYFFADDLRADVDLDGFITGNDYDEFIYWFFEGC